VIAMTDKTCILDDILLTDAIPLRIRPAAQKITPFLQNGGEGSGADPMDWKRDLFRFLSSRNATTTDSALPNGFGRPGHSFTEPLFVPSMALNGGLCRQGPGRLSSRLV
jgi:hypothetical protein